MGGKSTELRRLLSRDKIIVAPGAYNALSAKLVEQAGFSAIYMTGAGIAANLLGVPDIGLTTMNDVLDTAKNIVNVTNIPVICDTDTGYGNALNLMRTVREFERIGVAAIQIEDQVAPKKCGHIEGKRLVSKEEMVKKIEAFNYSKESTDFVLIARTDAIAVHGFDDAIDRARSYASAGADVIFIEAPRTIEEMKLIPKLLEGIPLLVNIVEGGGKTPILPVKDLESMGFRIAIFPISTWVSAVKAIQRVLKILKEDGSTRKFSEHMVSFQEMFELVGLSQFRALEQKFLTLK
jgi:methylisocitrate lyase